MTLTYTAQIRSIVRRMFLMCTCSGQSRDFAKIMILLCELGIPGLAVKCGMQPELVVHVIRAEAQERKRELNQSHEQHKEPKPLSKSFFLALIGRSKSI